MQKTAVDKVSESAIELPPWSNTKPKIFFDSIKCSEKLGKAPVGHAGPLGRTKYILKYRFNDSSANANFLYTLIR